jgi:hypothetical protein
LPRKKAAREKDRNQHHQGQKIPSVREGTNGPKGRCVYDEASSSSGWPVEREARHEYRGNQKVAGNGCPVHPQGLALIHDRSCTRFLSASGPGRPTGRRSRCADGPTRTPALRGVGCQGVCSQPGCPILRKNCIYVSRYWHFCEAVGSYHPWGLAPLKKKRLIDEAARHVHCNSFQKRNIS